MIYKVPPINLNNVNYFLSYILMNHLYQKEMYKKA